jgi:hypothetical protein
VLAVRRRADVGGRPARRRDPGRGGKISKRVGGMEGVLRMLLVVSLIFMLSESEEILRLLLRSGVVDAKAFVEVGSEVDCLSNSADGVGKLLL